MSIEGTAKTEYASLSGKIHTFVVDKTLSISGACADAKVVGDNIERLDDILPEAKEAYEEAKAAYDEAVGGMEEAARAVATEVAKEEVSKLTAGDVGAYSKAESVSDTTKALYGLGTDAVPDDVLRKLAMGDYGLPEFHVWEKMRDSFSLADTTTTMPIIALTVYYGTSIVVVGGVATIRDEQSAQASDSLLSTLVGKYIRTSATIYYCTAAESTTNVNGRKVLASSEHIGYVSSSNGNAYPPTASDGYSYKYLGQIGAKAQFAYGSYVGTGTYGYENENSLSFEFIPKVVVVSGANNFFFIAMRPQGLFQCVRADTNYAYSHGAWATWGGNTFSWYGSNSADFQLNASGGTYSYIAIG